MKTKVDVVMISSKGCKHCELMLSKLETASQLAGVEAVVRQVDSSGDEAVAIAVKHDLRDVPSVVIGDRAFSGHRIPARMLAAMMRIEADATRTHGGDHG